MANWSVSPSIRPARADMKERRKGMVLSPVYGEGLEVTPPSPTKSTPGKEMTLYHNQYRDFAFQKISPPDYGDSGSLARITGGPANEPDMVADFHFIALTRAVDQMLYPVYEGYIKGEYDTPEPVSDGNNNGDGGGNQSPISLEPPNWGGGS